MTNEIVRIADGVRVFVPDDAGVMLATSSDVTSVILVLAVTAIVFGVAVLALVVRIGNLAWRVEELESSMDDVKIGLELKGL